MVSQRRMYITKAPLDELGRSEGGSAGQSTGKLHSFLCRTRLENLGRVAAAKEANKEEDETPSPGFTEPETHRVTA